MKTIMENWRSQEAWHFIQEDLKRWLVAENYFTNEEMTLISEGTMGNIGNFLKQKFQDAKEWTYQKYLSFVKPLLAKLEQLIATLKKKGLLKKYRARLETTSIKLFATKKYIKLGAVFLMGLVKILTAGIFELPEKLEIMTKIFGLLRDGKWAAAAEELGLPFDEIKELVGSLKSFGEDLKDVTNPIKQKSVGLDDLELAES